MNVSNINKLVLSVKKILSNGRSRWRHERSEFFMSKENFNIKELLKIDKLNHFEINSF